MSFEISGTNSVRPSCRFCLSVRRQTSPLVFVRSSKYAMLQGLSLLFFSELVQTLELFLNLFGLTFAFLIHLHGSVGVVRGV